MRKNFKHYYLKIVPWGEGQTVDPTRHDFKVTAHEQKTDERVAYVCVCHAGGHSIYPAEVDVDECHRRRGIATTMYDWAEQITEKEMRPSSDFKDDELFEEALTEDAQTFWKARWERRSK